MTYFADKNKLDDRGSREGFYTATPGQLLKSEGNKMDVVKFFKNAIKEGNVNRRLKEITPSKARSLPIETSTQSDKIKPISSQTN